MSIIDTTSSHPFWVPGVGHGGRWVKASALKYGTHLRTPSASDDAIVVGGWVPRQRAGWMWDLNIPGNDDHDFYIDTDASDVLVHNACSSTSGDNPQAASGRQAHSAFSNMLNEEGNGYSGVQGIEGSNLRVDGVFNDGSGDVPLELKPATPGNLVRGWNQLEGYENAMGAPPGSGQLWMYTQDQVGNFLFTRVL